MKDSTFSRRHFEFVAQVVDKLDVDAETRRRIALDFARAFEGCNKSFHRDMFVNACLKSDMKRAQRSAVRLMNGDQQKAAPHVCASTTGTRCDVCFGPIEN